MVTDDMTLDRDGAQLRREGAQLYRGAAASLLPALEKLFARHAPAAAGTRLFGSPELAPLIDFAGPIATLAQTLLGPSAIPVRALLFDKSATANWGLGWHQDRVIAVRERRDTSGFTNWSVKQDVDHVTPPWELLAAMRTLRIHLDPVPADNAPLLVAPGSHRLGFIAEPRIAGIASRLGTRACLAGPGDIWAYATPILHASAPSVAVTRRRVLQLDYAAFALPGLDWYGV